MKRLNHGRRLYLVTVSRRTLSTLTTKNRRRRRNAALPRRISWRPYLVEAPVVFRFLQEETQLPLFEFLDVIKVKLSEGRRVLIDFRKTENMHPCGTLIFIAHLDVWLAKYPTRLSCTYPEDDRTEQLLQHIGVLSRLGLSSRKLIEHEHVKHWHYHTGSQVDSALYKDLTKSAREGIVHPDKELFADCLNEAVVNAVNHAYEHSAPGLPPKPLQKWWLLSLLKDDILFVAIYDLGVGIAASLRRKPNLAEYLKLRHYKDARLIEDAVSSKLTSTKMPHRGKGLPEMLEFSKNLKAGGLGIWSQKGGMAYNAEMGHLQRHGNPHSLQGTLVLWSIPFRKELENAN